MVALLKACPSARGIVFDLPHVVATTSDALRTGGVIDRCDVVGGDFFAGVPRGGDAYLLATVIHDWPDNRAVDILPTCRQAMGPKSRLLLIEQVVPSNGEYHPSKFDDLNMLVMRGGRERDAEEFQHLLGSAGFRLERIVPKASRWSVIEAIPFP
jgi:hypothetical protein